MDISLLLSPSEQRKPTALQRTTGSLFSSKSTESCFSNTSTTLSTPQIPISSTSAVNTAQTHSQTHRRTNKELNYNSSTIDVQRHEQQGNFTARGNPLYDRRTNSGINNILKASSMLFSNSIESTMERDQPLSSPLGRAPLASIMNPITPAHYEAPQNKHPHTLSTSSTSSATPTISKPFRCKYEGCDAVFGQKGSLTRHIRSRHEKLRPHTCDVCLKSFSALWTLRVHQRNVHLKSKPHKCHLCDKSFGELFNLSKHVAIVHEGKRPFSCPICSRKFGYKGDMRKHVLELHEQSGRPFQCMIPSCGVKFARKRYLRRHENLSHKGHPLIVERDRKEREREMKEGGDVYTNDDDFNNKDVNELNLRGNRYDDAMRRLPEGHERIAVE